MKWDDFENMEARKAAAQEGKAILEKYFTWDVEKTEKLITIPPGKAKAAIALLRQEFYEPWTKYLVVPDADKKDEEWKGKARIAAEKHGFWYEGVRGVLDRKGGEVLIQRLDKKTAHLRVQNILQRNDFVLYAEKDKFTFVLEKPKDGWWFQLRKPEEEK